MPDFLPRLALGAAIAGERQTRCPLGRSGCWPSRTPSGNSRSWTGSCSRVATSSSWSGSRVRARDPADAHVRHRSDRVCADAPANQAAAAAADVPVGVGVPRGGAAARASDDRVAAGAADRHSGDGSGRSARGGRLSGLPAGVVVERDRIEVRYAGAKEAVVKLVALAQALNHDYERFEALVTGEGSSG